MQNLFFEKFIKIFALKKFFAHTAAQTFLLVQACLFLGGRQSKYDDTLVSAVCHP